MKIINAVLAALLPLIFTACNDYASNSKDISQPTQNATLQNLSRDIANLKESDAESEKFNTEDYDNIIENKFLAATQNPLSTFSIDVDEAAYSNVRRYLQNGSMPPAGAVRIEEMINYFDYDYPGPLNDDPFTINTEISNCPWNTDHRLVHIGLQGKEIPIESLPPSNMVFLVDVSGSMADPNKLPLVQASMKLLTDQLREK